MECYAGLDVSLKTVAICVIDRDGAIVARGSVPTTPEAVARFLAERGLVVTRLVHESGQLSIWLQRGLVRLGLPAACIDARRAHKALSARPNKSDASDAEGLAQLARAGWFTEVHVRGEGADRLATLLAARDRLIRLRVELEGHVRGMLKTFGLRLTNVSSGRQRQGFREQLAAVAASDPLLARIADGFVEAHQTLCAAQAGLERELRLTARESAVARRLMTIPGVGPIVALSFMALVDDPRRFRRAADVGAYLGLTPRRSQSGEIDHSGRVSRCGNGSMRGLLFEAATALIRLVKRFSPLKSWAVRLAGRRGFKKAAVAAARKIAVLMLTLWKSGETFRWKGEPTSA
jgi:transposase